MSGVAGSLRADRLSPQSKYFAIQRVGLDQIEDYARRKGMTVGEIERWLRPALGYDPVAVPA